MLVGGRHIMTAAAQPITTVSTPCRVLTIRLYTGSGNVEFGDSGLVSNENAFGYLKADESWTWGPNAGTIDPAKIYVKGTAGNNLYWCGVAV